MMACKIRCENSNYVALARRKTYTTIGLFEAFESFTMPLRFARFSIIGKTYD
jgi:hypothetical protein